VNNKTLVDIILPNYNKKEYLNETIDSVINQSFKEWNLIIIDNNSSDGSQKILKDYSKYKNIQAILLSKNMGLSFSRNLGLRHAKNDFVAFLDSDDLWDKNKLRSQIKFMKQNSCLFSYTNYTPFYLVNNKKIFKKTIIPRSSYDLNSFVKDTSIATSSMIIKRKSINLKKFKRNSHNEDYDFKCKVLLENITANKLEENLTFYRITQDSRSSYKFKSLLSIYSTNRDLLKMSFLKNIISIFFVALNSIKKYGYK
tara:strand:+ start:323 stop:1087 length:765 start_codon:yes stop_codon:yes gene_type:complete